MRFLFFLNRRPNRRLFFDQSREAPPERKFFWPRDTATPIILSGCEQEIRTPMNHCPRCGPMIPLLDHEYQRCSICEQYLPPLATDQPVLIERTQDIDQSFAAPYHYNRTLIQVPGMSRPFSNLSCINQSVVNYIRQNFQPRDSDVWLATYPKAGTTWMQNILSYILYNEPNSSDGISVGLTPEENIVWFEAQCIPGGSQATLPPQENNTTTDAEAIEAAITASLTAHAQENLHRVNTNPKRRCFKSHSPLALLEPLITSQGKVIHVARSPKDIAVSMWHHTRSKSFGYDGPFDHFVRKLFLTGCVESDSWWDYVVPYCQATQRWNTYSHTNTNNESDVKNYTQILTVWYEELKSNPVEVIVRVGEFLDCPLTHDEATKIAERCSLETMKEAEQSAGLKLSNRVVVGTRETTEGASEAGGNVERVCGNQIREGKVGGWKKYFTPELLEEFDRHHRHECERLCVEERGLLPSWIIHHEEE
jgi:hypothetical protein